LLQARQIERSGAAPRRLSCRALPGLLLVINPPLLDNTNMLVWLFLCLFQARRIEEERRAAEEAELARIEEEERKKAEDKERKKAAAKAKKEELKRQGKLLTGALDSGQAAHRCAGFRASCSQVRWIPGKLLPGVISGRATARSSCSVLTGALLSRLLIESAGGCVLLSGVLLQQSTRLLPPAGKAKAEAERPAAACEARHGQALHACSRTHCCCCCLLQARPRQRLSAWQQHARQGMLKLYVHAPVLTVAAAAAAA
jgi:hypothetical protein